MSEKPNPYDLGDVARAKIHGQLDQISESRVARIEKLAADLAASREEVKRLHKILRDIYYGPWYYCPTCRVANVRFRTHEPGCVLFAEIGEDGAHDGESSPS